MAVSDQFERLQRMHGSLLGQPQEQHSNLYRGYPSVRGYLGRRNAKSESDIALFEAVLILALHQASRLDGDAAPHKVYLLVPPALETWAPPKIRALAEHMFGRLKGTKNVRLIQAIGKLFHHVMLGSQVFTFHEEPERWVAYGFSKTVELPEWMGSKLLDPSEVPQGLGAGV